jgi:signal transduction histidine kinase
MKSISPILTLCLIWVLGCAMGCNNPMPSSPNAIPQASAITQAYQEARIQAPSSLPKALHLIQEGMTLAHRSGAIALEAQGAFLYATLSEQHGAELDDLRVAVNHYLEAATLYEEIADTAGVAMSHYQAGLGFLAFKDHEQAIFYLLKALARYERLRDSSGILHTHLTLSDAFWGNGAWSVSMNYARMAEQLAESLDQQPAVVQGLIRQGEYFLKEENYDRTAFLFRKALSRLDTLVPSTLAVTTYNRLAQVEMYRHQPQVARAYLEQALAQAKEIGNVAGRAESLGLMAELALQVGNYAEIPAQLDTSMMLARRYQLSELLLADYQRYLNYLIQTKQDQDLPVMLQAYHHLRDSLEQDQRLDLAERLNAQFETTRREYHIGLLEEQRKTQAAELDKKRYQVQFAAAIGLALLLLAGISYQQYRSKRRINHQLEVLVARRTDELRVANQELNTFAYRTAHDIRGPVARLLGLCQLILPSHDRGDMLRYFKLIYQEAIQMDFMLHRFLEINSIKHHRYDPEPINLHEAITAIWDDLRDLAPHSRLSLALDISPELEIVADPMLVKIMLKNLLENAVLYSREEAEDGLVEVEAYVAQEGKVAIRIIDNGIGVAPKVAERVFEMFFRGTTASKGLGLGLYATDMAAQALSGSVRLVANNRGETEFIVQIPNIQPA